MDVDETFAAYLEELARKYKNGRKSDLIRDAVKTYGFLKDEESEKRHVTTADADGIEVKRIILP
jgi:hypothetical protein